MIDKVWVYRENRGMRILAASRDLREVFSLLRTTNREIVHAVPTPILQTVRPVLNRLNPSSQTGTSYQPRPPTETSPPGAAIVDLKRGGPALATTATQDSQAQSTVHCCIPRNKTGVRDAMGHGWPDRVCSHVTVGERNKTGLNSAGSRCWTTQGEGDTSLLLIKKKEEPNCCPLDPRQKFMHLYTWIISADYFIP